MAISIYPNFAGSSVFEFYAVALRFPLYTFNFLPHHHRTKALLLTFELLMKLGWHPQTCLGVVKKTSISKPSCLRALVAKKYAIYLHGK
jgi:hypothetical protein